MSPPDAYHVTPVSGEEYGWEIRVEGKSRAESRYQSKVEAIAAARRLARSHGDCQVLIHHRDGSIERCDCGSRSRRVDPR